ncbi:hypothetical protein Kpol_185p3 [Vanderwaltozyma polyspora DSM 70294]|uniref:C2H2-type domain-containing protein n=1 Tax=Vanderwaltozyma polyspora (strain ATCC 22028 / DSM 70294 / BCRC 21397 / CBS 2163 / NBRC 10782 / NRRL Y-8283 / UCD 57-17) TaxID=436907 RepID=A7TTK9_VANPO|nr:uncharacterized protein Kpol_185p3 [Vanderwaltozyma polyspora DSM 70294]EDO14400.1 hypothetical protein Kpol_185p3 [Vanderwaltozyma polyspora DSM 70294]
MTSDNLTDLITDTPFSLNFKAVSNLSNSNDLDLDNTNLSSAGGTGYLTDSPLNTSTSVSTLDMLQQNNNHLNQISNKSLISNTANTSVTSIDTQFLSNSSISNNNNNNNKGNNNDSNDNDIGLGLGLTLQLDDTSISGKLNNNILKDEYSPQSVDQISNINSNNANNNDHINLRYNYSKKLNNNNYAGNLESFLDDYVSNELLINDNHFTDSNIDRRYSEVITNPLKSLTNQRNSISHSIDFWNLSNSNNSKLKTKAKSRLRSKSRPNLRSQSKIINSDGSPQVDSNVSQMLNDFNMNFHDNDSKTCNSKSINSGGMLIKSPGNNSFNDNFNFNFNDNDNSDDNLNYTFNNKQRAKSISSINNNYNSNSGNIYSPQQQYSIKKQNQYQRNSISFVDNNSIRTNEKLLSKFSNSSSITNILSYESAILSDDDNDNEIDRILKSPKSTSFSINNDSIEQKFIKPSMILNENASKAAIAATSGVNSIDMLPNFLDNTTNQYDLTLNPTSLSLNKTPTQKFFSPPIKTQKSITPVNFSSTTRHTSSKSVGNGSSSASNLNTVENPRPATSSRRRKSSSKSTTPVNLADDESKPFKCTDCEKAFRRSEHLKRHIRSVHSSERPFACNYCEKKFSRSDNLSQHLKTHKKHGDF